MLIKNSVYGLVIVIFQKFRPWIKIKSWHKSHAFLAVVQQQHLQQDFLFAHSVTAPRLDDLQQVCQRVTSLDDQTIERADCLVEKR